ncbi:MFS transporter [Nonomuraea purpurea]|uniref:MFS transporter n=1 Tax=Nonomuraea purpurea TaxID=1849276 RepID=A0ABV8G2L7_9ACTN
MTFRTLWFGEIGARFGYQITVFLLPLAVATVLRGSAGEVGLVSAAQTIPVLAFSLLAGVWVGRFPERGLLIVTNLLRGAAFGAVGILYAAQGLTVWALLAVAAAIGLVSLLYDVGYQVTIPRRLPAESLVSANGFIQATTSVAQMAGPALAGFLVQSLPFPWVVGVTSGLFVLSALVFGLLRPAAEEAGLAQRPSVRAGLAFVWKCRPIRDLCLQSSLFNLHEQAFLTIFLFHGLHTLGLSAGTLGAVIGLGSVGALVGSLLAGPAGRGLHLGWILRVSIFVAAAALLVVPAAGGSLPLICLAFGVNGAALALYNVFAISLRQALPPERHLGPVTAAYRMATVGMMPLGSLLGGTLADLAGTSTSLWLTTVSLTASSLVLFTSPLRLARTTVDAKNSIEGELHAESATRDGDFSAEDRHAHDAGAHGAPGVQDGGRPPS